MKLIKPNFSNIKLNVRIFVRFIFLIVVACAIVVVTYAVSGYLDEDDETSLQYVEERAESEPTPNMVVEYPQTTFEVDVTYKAAESDLDEPELEPEPYIYLTEDELYLLGTVIYLEAGNQSYECKLAVGSVILNRMTTGSMTLNEVIYQPQQFSVVNQIPYSSPTEESASAAHELMMNGPTIDTYVTYFRASHYHNFSSYMVNYMQIDDTYFSYDYRLKPTE